MVYDGRRPRTLRGHSLLVDLSPPLRDLPKGLALYIVALHAPHPHAHAARTHHDHAPHAQLHQLK